MSQKIPSDAFEQYVAMGAERSYQALADRLGVTKRAVSKRAKAEDWTKRLERIERLARERADEKLVEHLEDMRVRHLKTLRAMNARALAALQAFPLTSGMEAIRAAELAIKLERLIAGEPTERQAVTVEETIKREYDRWLGGGDEDRDDEEADPDRPGSRAAEGEGDDDESAVA